MSPTIRTHIRKLQARAVIFAVSVVIVFGSIIFAVAFLIARSQIAFVFLAVSACGIACIVVLHILAKKEAQKTIPQPVVLDMPTTVSFVGAIRFFETRSKEENRLSANDQTRFFLCRKHLRVILYDTENFQKQAFNQAKKNINQKANQTYAVSQETSVLNHAQLMRLNLICAPVLNEELRAFLSQNTAHNLTRVEGVMAVAVVGCQLILPPLYGPCNLIEVNRYKRMVNLLQQLFA